MSIPQNSTNPSICHIHTMHVSIHYVLYLILFNTYNVQHTTTGSFRSVSITNVLVSKIFSFLLAATPNLGLHSCESITCHVAGLCLIVLRERKQDQTKSKAKGHGHLKSWHRMQLCDTNDNTWPASGAFFDCGFL